MATSHCLALLPPSCISYASNGVSYKRRPKKTLQPQAVRAGITLAGHEAYINGVTVMAEIEIQRKPRASVWPWVIVALVLVALAVWYFNARRPVVEKTSAPPVTSTAPSAPTGAAPSPTTEAPPQLPRRDRRRRQAAAPSGTATPGAPAAGSPAPEQSAATPGSADAAAKNPIVLEQSGAHSPAQGGPPEAPKETPKGEAAPAQAGVPSGTETPAAGAVQEPPTPQGSR